MNPQREFLSQRYQEMWDAAIEPVRRGEIIVDPVLAGRDPDLRRSLTVLIRPSEGVQTHVENFLSQLHGIEPDQYFYDPAELHVTVLSLFTGTREHERMLKRLPDYLDAVETASQGTPSFEIEFSGVTLSREAVLVRGFPSGSVLEELRERLRRELRARDLIEGLDVRYRLVTAHMTVSRFRAPLADPEKFAQMLESYRTHDFGQISTAEVHLVRNDWYMSRECTEVLLQVSLDKRFNF